MAFPFTPSKRPFERNPLEPNGRGKWQKTAAPQQAQFKNPPGSVIFRVLCPASKCGSVIGKGGGIVTKIRQETGAKVRLEEIVPGCDERVVVITGLEKDAEGNNEHAKGDDGDSGGAEDGEDNKVNSENNEEKEDSSALEGSKAEKAVSSAQKALLLVFDRIIDGEPEDDGGDDSSKNSVSLRILILSTQVGCLLGKGGSVIKQMSTDSGAQIRILPKDKLPTCASTNDEIVQITGAIDSVRKALQSVSQLLLENPPRDPLPAANPPGPSSHPFAPIPRPEPLPPANYPRAQGPPFPNRLFDAPDAPPSFPKFHESFAPGQVQVSPEPLTFRLMCSNEKVGSVIGKGGSIVKTLQHDTNCEIKVLETNPESDDRIIVITGPALPGDSISPAQDGVLRVQHRIVMATPDDKENVLSRLLVPSNQIGCLLGKGGAIIAEMRKFSGANIRILSRDQIPKSVSENDEVVQVTGEFGPVQEALVQITARLKNHLLRDKFHAINPGAHPAFIDQMLPFGSYMGRREPSPHRLYSDFPPFQRDILGRPIEDRPGFAHPLNPGVPHGVERIPHAPWAPQGMRESGGPMPILDYAAGAQHRRMSGFAGDKHPAFITNTTVDVVVPRALVPSIYGEDGGCLRRIREISEAKITITEPRPEATETVIIISGLPEQTHAAQSLIQAFVLSETRGVS